MLGTTPAAAWAGGVAASGGIGLPQDLATFVLDFLPFEQRAVRRAGVRLFNVTYFDGTLAPLLDSGERSCRVKYDPRDMSAVFVELAGGGHLRIPCADLGRPPVTLWEQRAATRTLREAGHRSIDETAIFTAIAEQRRVLAEAQAGSKLARRAFARLAERRSTTESARRSPSTQTESGVNEVDNEALVPTVGRGRRMEDGVPRLSDIDHVEAGTVRRAGYSGSHDPGRPRWVWTIAPDRNDTRSTP